MHAVMLAAIAWGARALTVDRKFAKWRPGHFAFCLYDLVQGRALPPTAEVI